MSKILTELATSVEEKRKRGESNADLFKRIMVGVSELSDDEWNKLSPEAQDYFNEAADAANKKADFPEPPDAEVAAEPAKEEPAPTRRRASAAGAEPATPKVGSQVKIINKRGKEFLGKIVEMDEEVVVLANADGEEELNRSRIESIEVIGDAVWAPKEEPKVGSQVNVVTSRGKELTGKIVEMDDEVVILETADGEEELNRARTVIEVIKQAGRAGRAPKSEPAAEEKPAGRAGRATAAPAKEEPAEKPARASRTTNGGVSVTGRVRDLLAANLDMKLEEVAKVLKKEGLEFRENTLQLTYAEFFKVVESLRKAGAMD